MQVLWGLVQQQHMQMAWAVLAWTYWYDTIDHTRQADSSARGTRMPITRAVHVGGAKMPITRAVHVGQEQYAKHTNQTTVPTTILRGFTLF